METASATSSSQSARLRAVRVTRSKTLARWIRGVGGPTHHRLAIRVAKIKQVLVVRLDAQNEMEFASALAATTLAIKQHATCGHIARIKQQTVSALRSVAISQQRMDRALRALPCRGVNSTLGIEHAGQHSKLASTMATIKLTASAILLAGSRRSKTNAIAKHPSSAVNHALVRKTTTNSTSGATTYVITDAGCSTRTLPRHALLRMDAAVCKSTALMNAQHYPTRLATTSRARSVVYINGVVRSHAKH